MPRSMRNSHDYQLKRGAHYGSRKGSCITEQSRPGKHLRILTNRDSGGSLLQDISSINAKNYSVQSCQNQVAKGQDRKELIQESFQKYFKFKKIVQNDKSIQSSRS